MRSVSHRHPSPELPDPRCDELERLLRKKEPLVELAHRYLYSRISDHCHRDLAWQARVMALELRLGPDAREQAMTLAHEIERDITGGSVPANETSSPSRRNKDIAAAPLSPRGKRRREQEPAGQTGRGHRDGRGTR